MVQRTAAQTVPGAPRQRAAARARAPPTLRKSFCRKKVFAKKFFAPKKSFTLFGKEFCLRLGNGVAGGPACAFVRAAAEGVRGSTRRKRFPRKISVIRKVLPSRFYRVHFSAKSFFSAPKGCGGWSRQRIRARRGRGRLHASEEFWPKTICQEFSGKQF